MTKRVVAGCLSGGLWALDPQDRCPRSFSLGASAQIIWLIAAAQLLNSAQDFRRWRFPVGHAIRD
ncbi:MAG: hypothetical protein NZ899_05425 [Thermoguttaceae bacterium]|nr:hypothetical protein [Thermoguttaceae bacterium]MDW8078244.1 hypothetical protein [Thermoguttaceae bacterium]